MNDIDKDKDKFKEQVKLKILGKNQREGRLAPYARLCRRRRALKFSS